MRCLLQIELLNSALRSTSSGQDAAAKQAGLEHSLSEWKNHPALQGALGGRGGLNLPTLPSCFLPSFWGTGYQLGTLHLCPVCQQGTV